MSRNRRSGVINVQVNGTVFDATGNFSYNLGQPIREELVGPDRVHGYKETPQVSYIEGEIRDASDLVLTELMNLTDATITLKLANGKQIMLREAWYAAEGTAQTEEANVQFKFCGMSAEEIT